MLPTDPADIARGSLFGQPDPDALQAAVERGTESAFSKLFPGRDYVVPSASQPDTAGSGALQGPGFGTWADAYSSGAARSWADFDPYADGFNPGVAQHVDTAAAIEDLREIAATMDDPALVQVWISQMFGDLNAAQLHELSHDIDALSVYDYRFRSAANSLRNAINTASGGTYLDQGATDLQPLYVGQQPNDGSLVPRNYVLAQQTGWQPDPETSVDLVRLVPMLESYVSSGNLTPEAQRQVQDLMGAIERGGLTQADLFHHYLAPWESAAGDSSAGPDVQNLANYVAGTIVQELGRSSGGAFTRAIYEPEARQDTWLQSLGRGIIDTLALNFLDEIEAVVLAATSGQSVAGGLAGSRNNIDLLKAANPTAYYGGQLAGLAGQTLLGGWLAPRLFPANTPLQQLGGAMATDATIGAIGGAGQATDWQNAAERALVGGAFGWFGRPSTSLIRRPALEFGPDYVYNVGTNLFTEGFLWPDDGSKPFPPPGLSTF